MLEQLQTWWQNTAPQTQMLLREGGAVVVVLLAGHFLGAMAARALGARNFDAALRLPGSTPPGPPAGHGFTPTLFAGLLVRLTVWAGVLWWLARQHGQPELAAGVARVLSRTWALASVLVVTLALASLLAQRVMDCLQGPAKEAPAARNGAGSSHRNVAGAVGAGVYGLVVLLGLLIAADFFDWPLTRSCALALWQLAQHLLTAGAALLLGCLGARWARDLTKPDAATTPEQRAGQYTALGLVTAATLLAVAVLVASAGVLFGLAALGVLGLLLWLIWGHLPDLAAGLQLRLHKVGEVFLDGDEWQVSEVGLLTTELCRAGAFSRLPNRRVLSARMHGCPAEVGRR
jgi:hypothetical protein